MNCNFKMVKNKQEINIKTIRINGISTLVRLPAGMDTKEVPAEIKSNFRKEKLLLSACFCKMKKCVICKRNIINRKTKKAQTCCQSCAGILAWKTIYMKI